MNKGIWLPVLILLLALGYLVIEGPVGEPTATEPEPVTIKDTYSINGEKMTEAEYRIRSPLFLAEHNKPKDVYLVSDSNGEVYKVSKAEYESLATMTPAQLKQWDDELSSREPSTIGVEVVRQKDGD